MLEGESHSAPVEMQVSLGIFLAGRLQPILEHLQHPIPRLDIGDKHRPLRVFVVVLVALLVLFLRTGIVVGCGIVSSLFVLIVVVQ